MFATKGLICKGCGKTFDIETKPGLRQWYCTRKCADWHYRSRQINKRKHREWHIIRHYKWTPKEYRAVLKAQGGRCAICKRPPRKKALSIDHSHKTGKVRALLCVRCNSCLGWLETYGKDAKAYLKRYGS